MEVQRKQDRKEMAIVERMAIDNLVEDHRQELILNVDGASALTAYRTP